MQALQDLLYQVRLQQVLGPPQRDIAGVQFDSRQVQPGELFVAVRGTATDGHQFIPKALARGAVAIVCENLPDQLQPEVTYLRVVNSGEALGQIAANWYGRPSETVQLIGVTGTNGKTTVTTLLFNLFRNLGYRCGLIGTVTNRIEDRELPARLTTPDALALQHMLADIRDAGCDICFMEASSIALHQHRTAGVRWTGAIFTNLTHDHLDYHGTFQNYLHAKQLLFNDLPASAFALTNTDDRNGQIMVQNTRGRVRTYALHGMADYTGRILENTIEGLHLHLQGHDVWCQLTGEFNAYNLLAAYATALELGLDPERVLLALSTVQGARGRFERVTLPGRVTGVVDYAHTPDALENVLTTARQLMQASETAAAGRIICLVGCGGDRDRAKRPLMGRIACEQADLAILTSDNPRSETPAAILDDMETGVTSQLRRKMLRLEDRREAIRTAARLAQPGDLILVAGKGHETYQEIQGQRHHFDDREELLAAFQDLYAQ